MTRGLAEIELDRRRLDIRSRWLLSAPALLLIAVAAAGPLLIVLVYSFLAPGNYGDVKWELSGEGWFGVFLSRDIFDNTLAFADAHFSIFWRTLKLALATTVFCLILGFPIAYFIASRPAHNRSLWLFLITIPFWTNMLIRTFAIAEVIRNEGLINTLLIRLGLVATPVQMLFSDFATLIGMTYVFLPLMVLPLYASLEKLDFHLVEAAYDLYASRRDVLLHVIVPQARPGIVAGSILVFIPALSAYVVPLMLGGGKNLMIGNLIELQFGQGRNWPLGAALSTTLIVVVMIALLVYVRNASKAGGASHG